MDELIYRPIHLPNDAELAYRHYRDASLISFGQPSRCSSSASYLSWLGQRVEEFPDGHVMALLGERVIGQLELQVPYGLGVGYVNLFYVVKEWRRLGFGRRMHGFAERYFRSWDAQRVELHVTPSNRGAVSFYRSLGYRLMMVENEGGAMWRMEHVVNATDSTERDTF